MDLPGYKPNLVGHPSQIKRAARLIEESQRPVILAGHGVIFSEAYDELRELAENGPDSRNHDAPRYKLVS